MKKQKPRAEPKPYQLKFQPGLPMELTEMEAHPVELSKDQLKMGHAVASTIKSYLNAAHDLLENKLGNIKDISPLHLSNPGFVLVLCCSDGIIIRYDSNPDHNELKIGIGYTDERVTDLASKISENTVYCYDNREEERHPPEHCPQIILTSTNPATGIKKTLFAMKICFNTFTNQPLGDLPSPPLKPYCLLSVRNHLEFGLELEMRSNENLDEPGPHYLTRTPLRLPVGWECIEIFPLTDSSRWKPQYAKSWAENDLLAAVVTHQLRESHYASLDPKAGARRQFFNLLLEFKQLLDTKPIREEILQRYLNDNPILLCPTYTKYWPKLSLGARDTGFVFREAPGDYLLVELEKSTHPLFTTKGGIRKELKVAQDQVLDWKRYIADNVNTVRTELNLSGISANPRSLIVIGRTETLTHHNRQKLQTMENESPKNKVMTYDDLYENTKAIIENLFGPLWGEVGNTQIYSLPIPN